MRNIALSLLLILGCGNASDGSLGADTRELNDEERILWNSTILCMTKDYNYPNSKWFPIEEVSFMEPRVVLRDQPCGDSDVYAACYYAGSNTIEFSFRYIDALGTLNEDLIVHEFKHAIIFQSRGDADPNHVSIWYSLESPCRDGFLDGTFP